ncbi:DUF58 domain-containing protein [Actinotalea sp.]|uniref:DUF58 domain-containing protein n=1 Tax=Actinotalea sp. TaxID=1872145 RepID=UPI0035656573
MRVPRRLRRALRTLLRPISGLGWAVAGAGAVMTALGWRLGWVEAAVVGAGLLGAFAVALVLTIGRSTYAIDLGVSDRRVRVGQRVAGRLLVRNVGPRRLLPARLELPVGHGRAAFPLPSLAGGAEHEELFAVPTSRRGVIRIGPVLSVRGDPWGLLRRRVAWTDLLEVHVHPEITRLEATAVGVLRDLEGQSTTVVSDADISFHALRDYVPGDDRRHIHWKTTARTGTLMVRQFEDTRRTHTAVALATGPGDHRDDDEFELAVSVAASIGVQALRDEHDLTFLAGARRLHSENSMRLLDEIAAVERAPDGHTAAELAAWVSSSAAESSVAILVTGSTAADSLLRGQVRHLRPGVRTVVLTCAEGAPSAVRSHGSLSLATVGSLSSLARVLRRAVAG